MATNSITSQEFEAGFSTFDNQAADDFVVPAGETWTIGTVYVGGVYFNGAGPTPLVDVYFYNDSSGLPGIEVYANTNSAAFTDAGGSLTIDLSGSPAVLTSGTYWVSVRADMDFATGGQWGWTERTVQFIIEGQAASCGGDITWVAVLPASGITPPGTARATSVLFDSTGPAAGTYTGTLCVNSSDPQTPTTLVPLTLTAE
ncbi:MAG: hypothetical protein AB1791_20080 [Chloroflexota bacterium]